MADNSVDTAELVDGAVETAKINDLAVTTGKIDDLAVTTGKLAATSVTAAKIGSDVAGNGLEGGNGSALSVNVDDSTIEISSDNIQVKDAGITTAKLSTPTYYTGTGGSGSRTTGAGYPGSDDLTVSATVVANRPIFVSLVSNGGTNGVSARSVGGGAFGTYDMLGQVDLYVDGVQKGGAHQIVAWQVDTSAAIGVGVPPSTFLWTLAPGQVTAGTWTFGVRFSSSGTNCNVVWTSVAVQVFQV
jgi:hypothetical protein